MQKEADPRECELLVLWPEHRGPLWEQELLGLPKLWPVQWLSGGGFENYLTRVLVSSFLCWWPFLLCKDLCLKTFCLVDVLCLQNGDYNKPIPAQYMEHLNHGVSGGFPTSETPKTHQWVNCQMLLCRKCNNNQSLKIKKLASFIPRNEVRTVVLF